MKRKIVLTVLAVAFASGAAIAAVTQRGDTVGPTFKLQRNNDYFMARVEKNGNFLAGVATHLFKQDCAAPHFHGSIYVANEKWLDKTIPATDRRQSRIDMQFGKAVSTLSLENTVLLIKDESSRIVLRSPNRKCWALKVSDAGALTTEQTDCKALIAPSPDAEKFICGGK